MAQVVQCDNCGAVLAKEDLFCGECGAPRPSLVPGAEPPPSKPAPSPPSRPKPARPARSSKTNWQMAAIVMAGLGAVLCLVGLILFAVFGMTSAEGYSTGENWLYSALCCLLPIAGSGALLLLIGAGIWQARLRGR